MMKLSGLSWLQRFCFCIAAKASYRHHFDAHSAVRVAVSASAAKSWGWLSLQLCAFHQTVRLLAGLYGY